MYYTPLIVAACIGEPEVVKLLLANKKIQIDTLDDETGVNAFWFAVYYGHGSCVSLLANHGCDIFVKHNKSNSNALHIAIIRKHYEIAIQLIQSKFPLNDINNGGMSPLLLISNDLNPQALKVAKLLINKGANIN